ncbi:hypothetical protein TWF481_010706 [Arthrobotrys musiformis]|uniref:F-box domain-containing protein n=1 Tax=Arthrobotrys musiformis TaxID=47236 RepID=A0AAV9W3Y0_9PEZI
MDQTSEAGSKRSYLDALPIELVTLIARKLPDECQRNLSWCSKPFYRIVCPLRIREKVIAPTQAAIELFGRDGVYSHIPIRSLQFEKHWDWLTTTQAHYRNLRAKSKGITPTALLKDSLLSLDHFPNITNLCINYRIPEPYEIKVATTVFAAIEEQPFYEKLKTLEVTILLDVRKVTWQGYQDVVGATDTGTDFNIREISKPPAKPMPSLEVARISINGLVLPWERNPNCLRTEIYYYHPVLNSPKLKTLTLETREYDFCGPGCYHSIDQGSSVPIEILPTRLESVRSLTVVRRELPWQTIVTLGKIVSMFPNLEEFHIKSFNPNYRPLTNSEYYESICTLQNLRSLQLPWPMGGQYAYGSLEPADLEAFVNSWLGSGLEKLEVVTFSGARISPTVKSGWVDIQIVFSVRRIDGEPGWELQSSLLDEQYQDGHG